ncbi:uncharacterized protein LOC132307255 isoform X2 [Cornus florida]|uniref:uncharacterized protein LOC132307255 isoform X2 n=1 Tax=Cornus florida TaxID=4283 RepID=UPI00289B094B|nr:uncharacterized protein LOC132307255 isoform X2 [Cornus florida]
MAHSNPVGRNDDDDDDDDDVELDKRNALLYNALMKEERSTLVELYCRRREQYPDGPLHVLTIHGDTVLHMAAPTVNADLVIQLLEMLADDEYSKLTHQNAVGNTILHEAAAFDKLVPAARRLLEKAPWLLSMHNKFGETALFSAARYGQIEMFAFLHIKVQLQLGDQNIQISEAERKKFYHKHNNTTVLHMAVILGHFDLALTIAKECVYLVAEEDEHGMTALQHLACNSAVFKIKNAGFLKHFIFHWAWTVPLWEAIWKEMIKYESAKQLARFLVRKDNTSWKETYPFEAPTNETLNNGGPSISSSASSNIDVEVQIYGEKSNSTPLFLAIKAGCVDIVEMILQLYPQAVEHVDANGCTILHIAVKFRQLWVFDVLRQVGIPWRRLIIQREI